MVEPTEFFGGASESTCRGRSTTTVGRAVARTIGSAGHDVDGGQHPTTRKHYFMGGVAVAWMVGSNGGYGCHGLAIKISSFSVRCNGRVLLWCREYNIENTIY